MVEFHGSTAKAVHPKDLINFELYGVKALVVDAGVRGERSEEVPSGDVPKGHSKIFAGVFFKLSFKK